MSITEYIPRPLSFGIEGRKKLSIRKELKTLRKRDSTVIATAKEAVAGMTAANPALQLTSNEVASIKPTNMEALYALPAYSLMYKSPHNIRHFAATDILSLFIGKYVNNMLSENDRPPLDITALRYSAWTHDSHRSRFDILGTIVNYQLHGIKASEQLEEILNRGGLPPVGEATVQLTREIDRYHDVDRRPYAHRSREVEVFSTVDKLELVRLFRPIQLRFKLPIVSQGIHMLARKRMRAYEGSREEFMGLMGQFLPIADGLFRLSMRSIERERKSGKRWEEIDQYGAVLKAAEELGIIHNGEVASERQRRYSTSMPEVKGPVRELPPRNLHVQKNTLVDRQELQQAADRTITALRESGAVLPTREAMNQYSVRPSFFRNPDQAINSMHNIRHHAGVEIGAVLLSADIATRQPELLSSLGLTQGTMQDMLLRVASVHDTARMWDDKESAPTKSDLLHFKPYRTVAKHGQEIAQLLQDKPQEGPDALRYLALKAVVDGLSQDQQDIFLAIVANHDIPRQKNTEKQLAGSPVFAGNEQKRKQTLFLLDVFRIADNMELVRSFYHYQKEREAGHKPNALYELFVNYRLFHYKAWNPQLQDLFGTYVPVIGELYQQTFAAQNPDQFATVMDAAERMGILNS